MSIKIVGRRAGISRGTAIIAFERDGMRVDTQIPTRERLNGFTTGRWLEYQIQKAAREAHLKVEMARNPDTPASKLRRPVDELSIEHIREYFPEIDHAR